MAEKFILMDLNDERSKNIAEILGNKTCKKIIDLLSERKEASEKDISQALSIPMNTAEYNLKKLIDSGLVEKTKNFFWSVKGRKIDMYRLSNKKIVISPKSVIKGVAPAFAAVLLGSFGIKLFTDKMNSIDYNNVLQASRETSSVAPAVMDKVVSSGASYAESVGAGSSGSASVPANAVQNICSITSGIGIEAWAWFLLGGLFVILIFLLLNFFKQMKGGLN